MTTNLVQPVPNPDLSDVRHAHFMAVCGAGMSPIAHLMAARGVEVDGCDRSESPVADGLRADGVGVTAGHDPAHLAGVDTVVVSSAIRADNPELAAARRLGLTVWHRSAALAALMAGYQGVAVSGTHGKSTTSAMIAGALRGVDPSFVIGAPLITTGSSHGAGREQGVFVIEADESDGSFLQYAPQVVAITNIDVDHLDRWGTREAYAAGFAELAAGPTVRRAVLSADDPGAAALAATLDASLTFGENPAAVVRLADVELTGLTGRATVVWPGGSGRLNLRVPGRHNLHDAAAAVATALALRDLGVGVDMDDVLAALADYRGIARRFQVVGQARGVTLVDDYAHHPAEIRASIAAARAAIGPGQRLVACFQPHLYSRTRDFADDFGQALAGADLVCVLDVYAAREDPIPGVTGELVADAAKAHGAVTRYVPTIAEAVSALADLIDGPVLRGGDLVMTLGAGNVTAVAPALLDTLREGGGDA